MNKMDMIAMNTRLLDAQGIKHPKRSEPTKQLTEQVKIIRSRDELDIDYTGMAGYKICGRSDGQVLIYIPLRKGYGDIVSMPFEYTEPLEVKRFLQYT